MEDRGREDTGHRPRRLGRGLQGVKEEGGESCSLVCVQPWALILLLLLLDLDA